METHKTFLMICALFLFFAHAFQCQATSRLPKHVKSGLANVADPTVKEERGTVMDFDLTMVILSSKNQFEGDILGELLKKFASPSTVQPKPRPEDEIQLEDHKIHELDGEMLPSEDDSQQNYFEAIDRVRKPENPTLTYGDCYFFGYPIRQTNAKSSEGCAGLCVAESKCTHFYWQNPEDICTLQAAPFKAIPEWIIDDPNNLDGFACGYVTGRD